MIENFELYNDKEGNRSNTFITLRNATITFSKAAIVDMKYAKFIHLFLDKKNHRVAFQPCKPDESAIRFYTEPEEGKPLMVRLANKKRCQVLMNLAGVEDCGKGIRYYGDYYEEEDLLVFDLKQDASSNGREEEPD